MGGGSAWSPRRWRPSWSSRWWPPGTAGSSCRRSGRCRARAPRPRQRPNRVPCRRSSRYPGSARIEPPEGSTVLTEVLPSTFAGASDGEFDADLPLDQYVVTVDVLCVGTSLTLSEGSREWPMQCYPEPTTEAMPIGRRHPGRGRPPRASVDRRCGRRLHDPRHDERPPDEPAHLRAVGRHARHRRGEPVRPADHGRHGHARDSIPGEHPGRHGIFHQHRLSRAGSSSPIRSGSRDATTT